MEGADEVVGECLHPDFPFDHVGRARDRDRPRCRAFLVNALDERAGLLRRIEIEPDESAHLLHEERIRRELEVLRRCGLSPNARQILTMAFWFRPLPQSNTTAARNAVR